MFFNLPTLFTWARILAIPLIVGVFYLDWQPQTKNLFATVLFVLVALTDWLDGVVELNFLDAKRDQVDTEGVPDPDTGGQTLYVTPRVGVSIVRGLVARAAVQIPVWENLNGIQDVKPAFTAGLTYVF